MERQRFFVLSIDMDEAVAAVLPKYEKALNQSDTEAVMKLYTSDGVFMPQHSSSRVGAAALRKAYEAVFRAITLEVKFNTAEICQIAPDWAFALTNSAGKVKIHATGGGGPEANQELFVFQKINNEWKIATAFLPPIPCAHEGL